MNNSLNLPLSPSLLVMLGLGFLALLVWTFCWKGLALWHSARRNHGIWFVLLLVVNTMGILEIIYLFGIAKVKRSELLK